jgi:hypothetical protein
MREQLRAPDQHNPLVPLVLGLLSLDRELDRLLETKVDSGAPSLSPDDPTLALFLGIVSVRRTLHRWLEHGCPANLDAALNTAPSAASPEHRRLPRDLGR